MFVSEIILKLLLGKHFYFIARNKQEISLDANLVEVLFIWLIRILIRQIAMAIFSLLCKLFLKKVGALKVFKVKQLRHIVCVVFYYCFDFFSVPHK